MNTKLLLLIGTIINAALFGFDMVLFLGGYMDIIWPVISALLCFGLAAGVMKSDLHTP